MLKGNSEAVWATLWKPEVSLNWLPWMGNMRTDLQKRIEQSWCEYQSKELLAAHILLAEWCSQFQWSIYVSWRLYRVFFNPTPTALQMPLHLCKGLLVICGGRRQSREGQWPWVAVKNKYRQHKTYANHAIIKMHSESVMEMRSRWANTHLSQLDTCHMSLAIRVRSVSWLCLEPAQMPLCLWPA